MGSKILAEFAKVSLRSISPDKRLHRMSPTMMSNHGNTSLSTASLSETQTCATESSSRKPSRGTTRKSAV
ncbi:hypothetical protein MLD38_005425 [Melastoma candidum]|uniref:Uncharacterized protein n=1 Tax=Melastoma candidum TaxID=119954 RepID=A0ACB9RMN2_9MYRT|nr:hypothetical protein MLD38_005425 [Melastoma candidum]